MKKFFRTTAFFVFVAFATVMFSCKGTGNKANEQTANDSVQVADTLSADSVAQNAEQEVEKEDPTLGGKGDLAAFDLHGNVKSCKWKDEYGTTHNLAFDEQGKWVKYNGKPLSSLEGHERDKNGRIASYVWGEMGCADNHILTFDSETGRLKKMQVESGEGHDVYTYKYDKKGLLTHRHQKGEFTEMGAEETEHFETNMDYEYSSIDDHGNWTKRTGYGATGSDPAVETRTIVYY